MDIKIITKSGAFLIYNEIQTLNALKKEIEKLGIPLNDIIIYFHDHEGDKVVLLDDQDFLYALQHKKNFLKFYVYYKLNEPKIIIKKRKLKDDDAKFHQSEIQDQCEAQQIQNEIKVDEIKCKERMTILPIENRTEKLRNAIDRYIDKFLAYNYEIKEIQ